MDYNSGKGNFLEILLKNYFHHFFKVWKILMHKNAIKKSRAGQNSRNLTHF